MLQPYLFSSWGGGFSNSAIAADVSSFDELEKAIENNTGQETINIQNDINFSDTIVIYNSQSITIDGGNNALNALPHTNNAFGVHTNSVLNLNNIGYTDIETQTITGISGFSSFAGAGVYADENTSININNSSFYNNYATAGGAIGNMGNMNILDSYFIGNASYFGGGITNSGECQNINAVFILNNNTSLASQLSTSIGSAIYNIGTIQSINSYFEKNKALNYGGAIANTGSIPNIDGGNPQLTDAKIYNIEGTFKDNEASFAGGAIYNGSLGGSAHIENITAEFTSNTAGFAGGAICNDYDSSIGSIQNSSFKGNTAEYGGAVGSLGSIKTISADFENNTSTGSEYGGGAIVNGGSIESVNSTFTENKANGTFGGAAILNGGQITSIDSSFKNNTAQAGGAITNAEIFYNNETYIGSINEIKGSFENNTATALGGGAIANSSSINKINAKFDNNTSNGQAGGGAILNSGEIAALQGNFTNNKSTLSQGGAIANYGGTINIISDNEDTIFENNTDINGSNAIANSGTINLNAGTAKIIFNDSISGYLNQKGTININNTINSDENIYNTSGTIELNSTISDNTINMYNGTLAIGQNGNFSDSSVFDFYGGIINLQNNTIQNTHLGNLTLYNNMDLKIDSNLDALTSDTITASSFNANNYNINISNINILQPTTVENFSISPVGTQMDSTVRTDLAAAIKYTGNEIVYSPIYKYTAEYDPDTALLNFTRFGIPDDNNNDNSNNNNNNNPVYNDLNPAIMSSSVAAQLGGYLTQLNSYDEAFRNMDMYMLMTNKQRQAFKYANKYASTGSSLIFSSSKTPYTNKEGWLRPYATFENVKLKNGPKVSNVAYGTFAGLESEMYELGRGWDGVFSLYAGYNGSHQAYGGNSIYQNGGTLGIAGMAYKGNLFTGLTANISSNIAQANTIYGNEDFSMLMTGIASKTGYNIEIGEGKFIIQPSYLMSYSFVNTFDYNNARGVRINSDPLHAIQIEPGIKFIGNLKNNWQPYAGISVVWNIMDKTQFKANDVSLPELSIKPFVKYGIGIRKNWGNKFTGFLQTYFTGGGRNGVGLQTGFKWILGQQ